MVVTIDHDRRLDCEERHVRDGDRPRGEVIKLNEVRFGLIGWDVSTGMSTAVPVHITLVSGLAYSTQVPGG